MLKKLDDLKDKCLACTNCTLCETRKNVVFGEGNPTTGILFIGEGPGENEDLQGKPFVGRGGQLLDKFLGYINLDRSKNMYITNIVKCRPPKNRDPMPEEQETCMYWLNKQIEIIKPKMIICLGRIAASKLIKKDIKITREHGIFFDKNGILMTATLHPAALLRNPTQKPLCFQDFLHIKSKLLELNIPNYYG